MLSDGTVLDGTLLDAKESIIELADRFFELFDNFRISYGIR